MLTFSEMRIGLFVRVVRIEVRAFASYPFGRKALPIEQY
jgi:hypothetical protein